MTTSSKTSLRWHQSAAVEQSIAAFGRNSRPLIQLPTGAGKSRVLATLVQRLRNNRRGHVVVVAHRDELLRQLAETLRDFGLPCQPRMIVGGVGLLMPSQAKKLAGSRLLSANISAVLVDEAHHCANKTMQDLRISLPPQALWAGCTATPKRLDGKPLDMFDELVSPTTVRQLIDEKVLCDFDCYAPDPQIAAQMKREKKNGDSFVFGSDELRDVVFGDAVSHYQKLCNGRRMIAFAARIKEAQVLRESFAAQDISASVLSGEDHPNERARQMRHFAEGQIKVLISVEVLGEGIDVKDVAAVAMLRKTESLTIYLQQVGRGLRTKADGSRAVILDHVGNVGYHGSPDYPHDWQALWRERPEKNKKKAEPAADGIKICSYCFAVCPRAARICDKCGASFAEERDVFQVDSELKKIDGTIAPQGRSAKPIFPHLPTEAARTLARRIAEKQGGRRAVANGLAEAQTIEQLREVAKKSGYDPKWADHYAREAAAAAERISKEIE